MKNKHLLLLFLCTLLLGFAAKYAPWFKSDVFATNLVSVEAANVQSISITQPKKTELLLERSDEGWVASQDDFAVRTSDSCMAPILAALGHIRSLRIVDSKQRDTLLLLASQAIHVEIILKNGQKEVFEIGREIIENKLPATFIEIARHDGIYLIDKNLRGVFTRSVDDFRNKIVLSISPESVSSITIFRPEMDTVFLQKSDSIGWWLASGSEQLLPTEQVQQWLKGLHRVNGLPFASHAEENLAAENLRTKIVLEIQGNETPLMLQIFDRNAQKSAVSSRKRSFLLHSSQNPYCSFSFSDTLFLNRISCLPGGE